MRSVLLDLYYGNYSLPGQKISRESAHGRALHSVCEQEDELMKVLSEPQKTCFKKYLEAQASLSEEECRMNFTAGYRLGARMIMEAMTDEVKE